MPMGQFEAVEVEELREDVTGKRSSLRTIADCHRTTLASFYGGPERAQSLLEVLLFVSLMSGTSHTPGT